MSGWAHVTVTLTPHAAELLELARTRGLGDSPEEIIERALEAATASSVRPFEELTPEEKERGNEAVDAMLAFAEKHRLTLGRDPDLSLRELLHEGHRY